LKPLATLHLISKQKIVRLQNFKIVTVFMILKYFQHSEGLVLNLSLYTWVILST